MNEFDQAALAAVKKLTDWHGMAIPDAPVDIPDMIPKNKWGYLGIVIGTLVIGAYLAFARKRQIDEEGYDPEDAPRL